MQVRALRSRRPDGFCVFRRTQFFSIFAFAPRVCLCKFEWVVQFAVSLVTRFYFAWIYWINMLTWIVSFYFLRYFVSPDKNRITLASELSQSVTSLFRAPHGATVPRVSNKSALLLYIQTYFNLLKKNWLQIFYFDIGILPSY